MVISASRRTDIPGGFTPWFLSCIRKGEFTVTNPFNRKSRTVPARPENVHTIVFWSKNYGPFIGLNAHKILADKGYNLFFNFTVNADNPVLEPGIPALASRLQQAETLAKALSPEQIAWRFDPICFFKINGQPGNNLKGFAAISDRMADMGITRCITSFYDPYKKVDRRTKHLSRLGGNRVEFVQPPLSARKRVVEKMAEHLGEKSIGLYLCCEAGVMDAMGEIKNLRASACIDGSLYRDLFGGTPKTSGDYGQRRKQGCRCTTSVDVGSYDLHPCPHNCLFCYARTQFDAMQQSI
ncbi:MAG: DUF1848 family protein [Desulfobacter sp.]|nr:MAG: DUF1848 family protein [Desulfobacter sp.]